MRELFAFVAPPHPALRATFSHEGRRELRHGFALINLLPLWEKVRQGMRGGHERGAFGAELILAQKAPSPGLRFAKPDLSPQGAVMMMRPGLASASPLPGGRGRPEGPGEGAFWAHCPDLESPSEALILNLSKDEGEPASWFDRLTMRLRWGEPFTERPNRPQDGEACPC